MNQMIEEMTEGFLRHVTNSQLTKQYTTADQTISFAQKLAREMINSGVGAGQEAVNSVVTKSQDRHKRLSIRDTALIVGGVAKTAVGIVGLCNAPFALIGLAGSALTWGISRATYAVKRSIEDTGMFFYNYATTYEKLDTIKQLDKFLYEQVTAGNEALTELFNKLESEKHKLEQLSKKPGVTYQQLDLAGLSCVKACDSYYQARSKEINEHNPMFASHDRAFNVEMNKMINMTVEKYRREATNQALLGEFCQRNMNYASYFRQGADWLNKGIENISTGVDGLNAKIGEPLAVVGSKFKDMVRNPRGYLKARERDGIF